MKDGSIGTVHSRK